MAKRRDFTTKMIDRTAKRNNVNKQRLGNLDKAGRTIVGADGIPISREERNVYRVRGRRGVRARARRDRIRERMANQPTGGTITNS